jgi:hypothetical protein
MAGAGGTRNGAGRPKGRSSPETLAMKATFEEMARFHAPAICRPASASHCGGSRISTSFGGTTTGRGTSVKIIDDPHTSASMRNHEVAARIQALKDKVVAEGSRSCLTVYVGLRATLLPARSAVKRGLCFEIRSHLTPM